MFVGHIGGMLIDVGSVEVLTLFVGKVGGRLIAVGGRRLRCSGNIGGLLLVVVLKS